MYGGNTGGGGGTGSTATNEGGVPLPVNVVRAVSRVSMFVGTLSRKEQAPRYDVVGMAMANGEEARNNMQPRYRTTEGRTGRRVCSNEGNAGNTAECSVGMARSQCRGRFWQSQQ